MGKVRIYLEEPLGKGQSVTLSRDHAHYLFGVMRLSVGDEIYVFDGRTGEYAATVAVAGKRSGSLFIVDKTRELDLPPDLWLIFAPIKKERTDFIVEKAAEMGVRRILPVTTDFTNSGRINRERLQSHAVEAAEQCGGTFVPTVDQLRPLSNVLAEWRGERRLFYADEALAGSTVTPPAGNGPAAVLIGPEGGFSEPERTRLAALAFAQPVCLGPRILRADTAAVVALAMWQIFLGDWR